MEGSFTTDKFSELTELKSDKLLSSDIKGAQKTTAAIDSDATTASFVARDALID